jgi:hypothetical protein
MIWLRISVQTPCFAYLLKEGLCQPIDLTIAVTLETTVIHRPSSLTISEPDEISKLSHKATISTAVKDAKDVLEMETKGIEGALCKHANNNSASMNLLPSHANYANYIVFNVVSKIVLGPKGVVSLHPR